MSLRAPESIRSTYSAWRWTVAWEWPDLAITWRLEDPITADARFLKVVQSGHHPTPLDEAARTRWARPYLPVPEVIDCGSDGTVDWLVTVALAGLDATHHPAKADPARLVAILARGLAAFHAAAPVDACPFRFRVADAIGHVHRRVQSGIVVPTDLHPEHAHLGVDGALAELERLAPQSEDLVVCHGDYCFPNVLVDEADAVTGYVDLGELGVADRWWDVAIGAWSATWNVGPGLEARFYEAYGIEPDEPRIRFYRLLYDLAS